MRAQIANSTLAAIFLIGCSTPIVQKEIEYKTKYYDRNGDGKVDFERHNAIGLADADWYLEDTDFDGRYDQKVRIGYAIINEKADQPVSENVQISRTPNNLRE